MTQQKDSNNCQKVMYLLDVIFIVVISQLLNLKLHVRQHATREDHKNKSSIISKPQNPRTTFYFGMQQEIQKMVQWLLKNKKKSIPVIHIDSLEYDRKIG